MTRFAICTLLSFMPWLFIGDLACGQDWARFRGPNGSGISEDAQVPPTEWSDSKNIKWKVAIPGPGHSSPIVVGDRVFVTYWSGYGVTAGKTQEDLRLHLMCVDRVSGEQLWDRAIAATLPEEPHQDMFIEHGYASHTPVTDGQFVWAFFGKSGAVCFDLDGKLIWRKDLGGKLDPDHWGSASSPILFKDILIVVASVESNAVYGLNKLTGDVVWKRQSDELVSTWSTPILVPIDERRTDLVLPIPYKLWGLDPETGELRWQCDSLDVNAACSSAVADQGILYYVELGRQGGGSTAIRTGGLGNVSGTHVVWKSQHRGHIGTPIVHDGKLYWINSGIMHCVGLADGESIFRARLKRPSSTATGGADASFPETGTPGGHHSSPVVAGGIMFYVSRNGNTYVFRLGDHHDLIAINAFAEGGDFSATPAISQGELFVRSTKILYCISSQPGDGQ